MATKMVPVGWVRCWNKNKYFSYNVAQDQHSDYIINKVKQNLRGVNDEIIKIDNNMIVKKSINRPFGLGKYILDRPLNVIITSAICYSGILLGHGEINDGGILFGVGLTASILNGIFNEKYVIYTTEK